MVPPEGDPVGHFPAARDARVLKRAGKMFGLHVHAHVGHRPVAEDPTEGATAPIVRRADDEPVKIFHAPEHQAI